MIYGTDLSDLYHPEEDIASDDNIKSFEHGKDNW